MTARFFEIGGLWAKTAKNGRAYMSGRVVIDGREHRLTIWPNAGKESTADTRQPDYIVQAIAEEPEPETEHPF